MNSLVGIGIAQWCLSFSNVNVIFQSKKYNCTGVHLDLGRPDKAGWLGTTKERANCLAASKQCRVKLLALSIDLLREYNINQPPNTPSGRQAWSATQTAINVAAELSIPLITLPSFDQSEIKNQKDKEYAQKFFLRTCEYSSKFGLQIASENNLGAIQQLEIIQSLNLSNFWILFDTFNPLVFDQNPLEIWQILKNHIYPVIHVKDGRNKIMGNCLLGHGDAPLEELIVQIKKSITLAQPIYLVIETEYLGMKANYRKLWKKDVATLKKLWNAK